jgi:hypothetical protein
MDSKVQQIVVGKLVSALTSQPTVATSLKLSLLTSLFNSSYLEQSGSAATGTATTATQRATIYMALLQLALVSGNAPLLSGSYGDIDAWCNDWKLPKAKQAELYLLLAQVTKAADEVYVTHPSPSTIHPFTAFSLTMSSRDDIFLLHIPHAD